MSQVYLDLTSKQTFFHFYFFNKINSLLLFSIFRFCLNFKEKIDLLVKYILIFNFWKKKLCLFVCLLGPGKPGSYLILIKKKKNKIIYEPNASAAVLGAQAAKISRVSSLSYSASSFLAFPNFKYIILINFLIRLIPLLSLLAKDSALLYLTL